jgi:hypothetical protein
MNSSGGLDACCAPGSRMTGFKVRTSGNPVSCLCADDFVAGPIQMAIPITPSEARTKRRSDDIAHQEDVHPSWPIRPVSIA